MQADTPSISAFQQQLGDGLVLRCAQPADTDALAQFNLDIHDRQHVDSGAPPRISTWVRDLMSGSHPTFRPQDFLVVLDTATGKIVSSSNLISQVWTYAGIPFKVGRPELVGSDPQFRQRGLVRAQFDVLHRWSAERGERVQGITGIPYYYRQFGYEMVLDLGGGRDFAVPQQIPLLKAGQSEPFAFRPASESDIPFLLRLLENCARRCLVATQFSEDLVRYELLGKHADNVNRSVLKLITLPDGQPVGCFAHPDYLWSAEKIACNFFELLPGVSWFEAAPSVLRALQETGKQLAEREGKPRLNWVALALSRDHPAYAALDFLNSEDPHPYAWYLRLPDLPGFLRLVAPALEANLASSDSAGWSGSLAFTFYRSGLDLVFDHGKLMKAEPLDIYWENANAAFPGQTFLQLLFGYRTLTELQYAFPDCWSDRELRPLIEAIFPKKPSFVLPIS